MTNVNKSIDEIKDRIAKRREKLLFNSLDRNDSSIDINMVITGEEKTEVQKDPFNDTPNKEEDVPNLMMKTKRNWFVFRFMISILLIVAVFFVYHLPYEVFQNPRSFIGQALHKNFSFAKNNVWVSKRLGNLYSYIPLSFNEEKDIDEEIIPVSGKIRESFKKNGKGIVIETGLEQKVRAIDGGIIIFAGKDNNFGNTIVIQQENGLNVWYGQLMSFEVNLYDHVKKGEQIGSPLGNGAGDYGEYYFAIEKDDKFVDPMQVIFFE